ncbi:MAG: isoprenylcysteine carboxylmethyltransferase family protein [Sedimentisphaerales bacterium]|nr:isoprenylcysteine carboxylmethyltransferase family protein [Sedimentisphaerales bacterium]
MQFIPKSKSRKYRIVLSRVLAVLLMLFVALSQSTWENRSSLFTEVVFLAGVFFASIASLGRLWCSLYIAGRKTKSLVIEGPYSISRNPLYFFSMIGILGVGLSTETIIIPFVLVLVFALYYPFVIKSEEERLREEHGEKFDKYVNAVPRFFPKISLLNEPQEWPVDPVVFRKHIISALWFIWLIGIIEFIEGCHEQGLLPVVFNIY